MLGDSRRIGFVAGLVAATIAASSPSPARACGGTFCDAARGIPVDQSGETVLFVRDKDEVEAHIQIAYQGDPDRFAWVIPVMAVPEFAAGSQRLFDNLLDGSAPRFASDTQFEDCDDDDDGGGGGGGMSCSLDFGDGDFTLEDPGPFDDDEDDEFDPDEDALYHDVVGAYEVAVLEVDEVDELYEWLAENNYAQDQNARPILEEYLEEGFLFAALRLRPGLDTQQIHPIVMRYVGTEPCIPIRLTRIAAVDDMPIQAFFLSNARIAPLNYRHVELNLARINWRSLGTNYRNEVAFAVDEAGADGRSFVTEYAGSSDVVSDDGLADARWNADDYRDKNPTRAVVALKLHGLIFCVDGGCEFNHPLVEGIAERHLPIPPNVPIYEYYTHPEDYEDQVDLEAWDADALADDLDAQIFGPGFHAVELLQRWPYLTRLYTRISPHEMLEDPLFHLAPDLPDVEREKTATVTVRCDGIDVFELPDGRQVGVGTSQSWPVFEDMPSAERVEEIGPTGAPIVITDNEAEIDALLIEGNELELERTGASIEALAPEWGGGYEDDGCGSCNVRQQRHLQGALWMLVIFGFAWTRRRGV